MRPRLHVLSLSLACALALSSAAHAVPVSFRTDCDDANTLYVSSTDTATGTFISGHSWTRQGSFDLTAGAPTYLHVWGQENSGGEWMSAYFAAPSGYVFEETGGRFLTTTTDATKQAGRALWSASLTTDWEDPAYVPWDPATSPYPPASRGNADANVYPPGAQRIWCQTGGDNQDVYFSTKATLALAPTVEPAGSPLTGVDTSVEGMSTHVVHTTGNLSTLAAGDTALGLRPGDSNHYASQVLTIDRGHIDTAGHFGGEAGVLAPDERSNGALAEHYAATLAGYVYAPSDGYTRTFAVGADDGYRLRVGDTVVAEWPFGGGVPNPHDTVAVRFPTAGYWPVELTWFQGTSGVGLEFSSREGEWTASDWNTTDFAIVGTDPAFPIYARPDGVPAPGEVGAESVGAPLGARPAVGGDGLRVQMAFKGSSFADVNDAAAWLTENPTAGIIAPWQQIDFYDPQNGSTGEFPYNHPFPGSNPSADDNYIAARISGVIDIPSAGDYTFAVGSDDGFRLRVGDRVIGTYTAGRGDPGGRANFCHAHFDQPGLYPVELVWNENTGGASVEFSYGPFTGLVTNSVNPNTAGLDADFGGSAYSLEAVGRMAPVGHHLEGAVLAHLPATGQDINPESWTLDLRHVGGQGLLGEYYSRNGETFGTLRGSRIDLAPGHGSPAETEFYFPTDYANGPWGSLYNDFIVRWTGFIEIPEDGLYHFRMDSDDRSWIYIDTDGDGTLEAAPGNNAWTVHWNDLDLAAGLHAVEFRALEFGGGENSRLQWDTPWGGWQTVPATQFSHDSEWWETIASGTSLLGSYTDDAILYRFPHHTADYTVRLHSETAGQWASEQFTFTAVPEPTSLALLGLGALALLRRRKK